jgi:hypothetical protein
MTKRKLFACLTTIATVMMAGPAVAQSTALTCSNAGNIYQVGEMACIAACHGARRLARCERVAESAIWTYVSDVCPSAHLVPPPPTDASQIPTVALMTPRPGPLKISTVAPELALRLAMVRLNTQRP